MKRKQQITKNYVISTQNTFKLIILKQNKETFINPCKQLEIPKRYFLHTCTRNYYNYDRPEIRYRIRRN